MLRSDPGTDNLLELCSKFDASDQDRASPLDRGRQRLEAHDERIAIGGGIDLRRP